jgi:ribosomal protein S12 methylthiotransferase accessory factor
MTPGTEVPAQQWPRSLELRVQSLQSTGCKVAIHQLKSPWAHVALVSAQHPGLHFTTLGAAASHSFTVAASNALDEAETRVYAWLHGHACTIQRPDQVTTVEHHFEVYGLRRYFKRADRVLFPPQAEQTAQWPRARKAEGIESLTGKMKRRGLHPIALDITPRLHHIDQGRTPLFVTRALVPGFIPLSFGKGREALGMASRFHPGSQFPHPFP